MSIRERTWFAGPCALMAMTQIFATIIAGAEEPQEIRFHDSYHKAIQEARLTQRPIFLEFRCAP